MIEVIDPAEHRQLATLEAVKADLQIVGSDDDDYLGELIDQASAAIETYCGRVFATERVRETIDQAAGTESLMVSRFPVGEIHTASIAGTDTDVDTLEIDDGGFLYRTTDGRRTSWPLGRSIIEYDAGYALPGDAEPTLPEDITRAAILLVRHAYFGRGRDPSIRTEESTGVGSTTYGLAGIGNGNTLPPEVQGLLSRYQISAGF
jgi:uncharacterized phiE125 gp8 family phage protein